MGLAQVGEQGRLPHSRLLSLAQTDSPYQASVQEELGCRKGIGRAEKTLESPLDCKDIQPVHSEGDQPWDFFGRNDATAETPVLWPPHAKS